LFSGRALQVLGVAAASVLLAAGNVGAAEHESVALLEERMVTQVLRARGLRVDEAPEGKRIAAIVIAVVDVFDVEPVVVVTLV